MNLEQTGSGKTKNAAEEAVWASRAAEAQRAYERKLRAMTPEERAAALAADKAAKEQKRARAEEAAREEEELKKALSEAAKKVGGETGTKSSKQLGEAIAKLSKSEDESYRVYLETKVKETEKKIQRGLMESGSIDERDSEALADWKEKLTQQQKRIEQENPYEEITIEDWKKAS